MNYYDVVFKSSTPGLTSKTCYENTKRYAFKSTLEIKPGDQVICDTSVGLSIGTVVSVARYATNATQWIIAKIDLEAHREAVVKEERKELLKLQLEARRKQIQNTEIYAALAEKDPEMAAILEEYNKI